MVDSGLVVVILITLAMVLVAILLLFYDLYSDHSDFSLEEGKIISNKMLCLARFNCLTKFKNGRTAAVVRASPKLTEYR